MTAPALDDAVEARLRERLVSHFGKEAQIGAMWPAGHYARFHVAVDAVVDGPVISLFLKCLKPERQDVELAAYEHMLPLTSVRTPRLLGRFLDWELPTQWLVLERVEGRWLNRKDPGELQMALGVLGTLHGQSAGLAEQEVPACLRYPSTEDKTEEGRMAAELAACGGQIGLCKEVEGAMERNLGFLRAARKAFTHGDNDVSNLMATENGICVLDWETARWASPAVDLGNGLAWLPAQHSDAAMAAYWNGFEEAGGTVPDKTEVDRLVTHGRFRDGLRVVDMYMQRIKRGPPDAEWYETFVAPRIATVNELAAAGIV